MSRATKESTPVKDRAASVTRTNAFFNAGEGLKLFSVNPGVPAAEALGAVLALLGVTSELMKEIDYICEEDVNSGRSASVAWGARQLLEMATAVVEAVEVGS